MSNKKKIMKKKQMIKNRCNNRFDLLELAQRQIIIFNEYFVGYDFRVSTEQ